MKYKITQIDSITRFFRVEILLENLHLGTNEIHLPAWRPGRYQIQNFAKFLKKVEAYRNNGEKINIYKFGKESWKIENNESETVLLTYQFYADTANAGGSAIRKNFLYINPINCLMYRKETINEPCNLEIEWDTNSLAACGLDFSIEGNSFFFQSNCFHELADSPIMIADKMETANYIINETTFHIWIYGRTGFDWNCIISDFKKFTQTQIEIFGIFPEKEFHFMLWVLPDAYYHGVEHTRSTMMVLGPAEQDFEEMYIDLLGLASHELFHVWNVKHIRPAQLLPYDYSKENYFNTCFIVEGITTFYGDYILWKSGVFNDYQYFKELETTLRRHFENDRNADLSLLESSFDLWLDGYEKSIPNRTVSVYNKGALAALILNSIILDVSNGSKSLNEVMRLLWDEFGEKEKGYTYQDYINICEKVAGVNLNFYFEKIIESNKDILVEVNKALKLWNKKLQVNDSNRFTLI